MKKKTLYLLVIVIAATLLLIMGSTKVNAAVDINKAITSCYVSAPYDARKLSAKDLFDVSFGNLELVEGIHYKITFLEEGNDVGTYHYRIEGIEENGYTGLKEGVFKITSRNIIDVFFNYFEGEYEEEEVNNFKLEFNKEYTGNVFNYAEDINNTLEEYGLVRNRDWTLEIMGGHDFINVYRNWIVIKGKGNYAQSIDAYYNITPKDIFNEDMFFKADNMTYTGEALEPEVEIKDGKIKLQNGKDYDVKYEDNINTGTAWAIITGKGNYTGDTSTPFEIQPKNIEKTDIIIDTTDKNYTGKEITTTVLVKDKNIELKEGTDYVISYRNNKEIGTAEISITGKGNYIETVIKNFQIIEPTITSKDGIWKYRFINKNYPYEGIILTEYLGNKKTTLEIPKYIADGENNGTYYICGISETMIWNGNKPTNAYFESFLLEEIYKKNTKISGEAWPDYNYVVGYFYDDDVTEQREWAQKFYNDTGKTTILLDKMRNPSYSINKVYDGNQKSIKVIDKIDNVYLENVEEEAFKGTKFEEIILPNTILLWDGAFSNCINLKKINIPSEAYQLTERLFEGCKSLTSITIPSRIEWISSDVFKGCVNLTNINIPKSVTEIGNDVFEGDKKIVIKCDPDSRALQYVDENNLKYVLTSKINIKSNKNILDYIDCEKESYTGKTIKKAIDIRYDYNIKGASGNIYYFAHKLAEGTDYTISYKNNKNIGTATVIVTGKGNFTGTITKTFKIVPKKATLKSVKNSSKKAAKITWKRDKSVTGYEVYVSERVVDKNYMKTTAESLRIRKSASTKSKTVDIVSKGTKLKILKKNVKKENGYYWYKVGVEYKGEDGEKYIAYEGYVTTKYLEKTYKAKKYKKVKTIKNKKTTSYTAKKLTKGKTYYARVRSYKTVSGKKIYGSYSSSKTVKIKK